MKQILADAINQSFFNSDISSGYSDDAQIIAEQMQDAVVHFLYPATQNNPLKKFAILEATWKQETLNESSITNIFMNSSYQSIIGMGPMVIPLILRSMEMEPAHWFWALKSITTEDPVDPDDVGNLEKMTKSWLNWGKENGYI